MYTYQPPHPIAIKLIDGLGLELREEAAKYISGNLNTSGAERGTKENQGFGALAEIVIRNKLGMPNINATGHPVSYDILLPSGVKVDVKCRGGDLAFSEEYPSNDGLPREAKHNLWARQVFDKDLDTDIYLLTHLETPKDGILPGNKRQRKWTLYVCGWVSKKRAAREGVYLPRGSLSERGSRWMQYRGQEIEFYNKNLNGFSGLEDISLIEEKNVKNDERKTGDLNLTSVDAIRIAYDLAGRGVLTKDQVETVKAKAGISQSVKPILHPNQYFHLLKWLKEEGQITIKEINKAKEVMREEHFTEI